MLKITIWHENYTINPRQPSLKQELKEQKKEKSIHKSLSRSRTAVQDIILINKFDLWCTFTFNKAKIDRYDINACKTRMSTWLFNQRYHSPNLKYIIVPELHKDGALHFHALLANFNGKLKDTKKRTKTNQKIYNATGYRSGFTKFIQIDENTQAIAQYMTKTYLTKDMITFSNSKRYWTSRNVIKPQSHVNGINKFNLRKLIQLSKPTFINNVLEIHYIPKSKHVQLIDKNNQTALPIHTRHKQETNQTVPTELSLRAFHQASYH